MHILIDLAIILIIAGTVFLGYRKGLIVGLCGILAIIISFYGAHLISNTYYEEFTPILEPFVGGLVDDAVQKTTNVHDEEDDDLNDLYTYTGATDNQEGAYYVALMTLGRFGFAENAANDMAQGISQEVDRVGAEFKATLTNKLCALITKTLSFTIIFLLIMIIFTVISNILNLHLRIPGLDIINNIGGAAVGLVKAWVIVSLIAFVLRYSGAFISAEMLRKTALLEFFMNHNVFAAILGM